MTTFIIGLVILLGGAALYGRFCEKVFGPDDRKTPAYTKQDGVDYVPMRGWKNSLINLLNIAGTGPILGPIQGILFGPIAFLTIPIGNVIGGAMHDYFSGMICLRDGGTQMPEMIRRYSTKGIYKFYNVFVCVLLLLVGAVFIYTPGDIAATQVFGFDGKATSVSTWVIYGVIFLYYLIATVFPIDAIIGKIYPIFGGILLFSAIGIFIGIHHNIFCSHERKLCHNVFVNYLVIYNKSVYNIKIKVKYTVYCKKCFRYRHSFISGIVESSLKPLCRTCDCRVHNI